MRGELKDLRDQLQEAEFKIRKKRVDEARAPSTYVLRLIHRTIRSIDDQLAAIDRGDISDTR